MGGSAAQVVNRVADEVNKVGEESEKKVTNYAADLVNDTGRTALAIGTAGASETIRGTAVEADQAVQRDLAQKAAANIKLQPAPTLPGSGGDTKPPEPGQGTTDTVKEKKEGRGRASTILTGARGLGSNPTTARRTLLGV